MNPTNEPRLSGPPDLDHWPYPYRRYPTRDAPDYLPCQALSVSLRAAIAKELKGSANLRIADVGCGVKPFYPFLAAMSGAYVGTDLENYGGVVDRICPAEQLAIDTGWADLTLCMSVLEHVDDPPQVVRELGRITRPGGLVFAATHGCYPWHPHPQDHWRWTQTGLRLLFERDAGFKAVEITATHGSVAHIFFLLAHYFSQWSEWGRWRRFTRRPVLRLINTFGERLDRRYSGLADVTRRVTAIPEFFVIARK